ncbi:Uncharacterised protein [Bordetella pertussis]|nr:Uncharacterised protein [Bordetella pertussis]
MEWLGRIWASLRSQKSVSSVSTWPLPGMGSSRMTSNAEMRSDATISSLSSPTAYISRTLPRPRSGRDLMLDSCKAEVTGWPMAKIKLPARARLGRKRR